MKLKKEQIDAGAIALTQATKPPAPRRSRGRQVKAKSGIKLVRTSVQLEQWHVEAIGRIAKDKGISSSEVLRQLLDQVLTRSADTAGRIDPIAPLHHHSSDC